MNDNYSKKPWQQIQAESLEFIHRLINMINVYDPEHKYDYLHSAVKRFHERFAYGDMQVYELGGVIQNLSGMLSRTMASNDFCKAYLAERSNQPCRTVGMKKYYAKTQLNEKWEFHFKTDEAAKKAFDNVTEDNYIVVDDLRVKCLELAIPCVYWADGQPEPTKENNG